MIFVDELGGRIHAWLPALQMQRLGSHIIEGETYDVQNFVVRNYTDIQNGRCFRKVFYIRLNHMTQVLHTGAVDYIPHNVFQFTKLSALMAVVGDDQFLIDVVGILVEIQPITSFTNNNMEQESCIQFTITDIEKSAQVIFYKEMAQSFNQAIHDAVQHPIIVIISSCKAQMVTGNGWRLKVRLTRMWNQMTRNAQRVAINLIFVDALGGRIHATIPAPYIGQLENYFTEGETYDVNNFIVRRYADMQHGRCFKNDIYIQLNNLTEVMVTGGVDYIQQHVFDFTDLDALYTAAQEQKYLIDVVGILEQAGPLTHFRNRLGQEEQYVEFRITDMFTSARAVFYNEMAEEFHQAIQQANQHPIVVIISSCKPQMFSRTLS
ncbi:hypothetical protein DCAR_0312660 [Daucus carota subsp. sativus]|uniref:Replication protein A 70 kDa DNA-binding subunit B/D first OB fold domain-containing protein n=1 Tax=Daucus carota subsp. sativus TaxID=79200 RepID=A0AAF1AUW0_DAUCS|nr:hypothetical protein DCAR_0312660 [Daucus carota subsp. sativus]